MAELRGHDRDHVAEKPKIVIVWDFKKETANLWHKIEIIDDYKTSVQTYWPKSYNHSKS